MNIDIDGCRTHLFALRILFVNPNGTSETFIERSPDLA